MIRIRPKARPTCARSTRELCRKIMRHHTAFGLHPLRFQWIVVIATFHLLLGNLTKMWLNQICNLRQRSVRSTCTSGKQQEGLAASMTMKIKANNSSPQTPVCQTPTEQISNINPTRDMHVQWTSSFCLLTYYVCTCTWRIELCTAHITHSSDHIFPQTACCPPSSCPHHTQQHSAPSPGALASARPANRQLRPTALMPEAPR